jgi:hypothetical protein
VDMSPTMVTSGLTSMAQSPNASNLDELRDWLGLRPEIVWCADERPKCAPRAPIHGAISRSSSISPAALSR